MSISITSDTIRKILTTAGVVGFNGEFSALGGGEVNNTYKIETEGGRYILRVAKDIGQESLNAEARALRLLDSPHIPKLVYFDKNNRLENRLWILESYIKGAVSKRLSLVQFKNLGTLLAETHKVPAIGFKVNLREQFLDACKSFGDERYLLNHPNQVLKSYIKMAYKDFENKQPLYNFIVPTLIHSDVTPSNILVDGDKVGLIDWEFSKFNDPMADFSTIYYEDMEYNKGKWRIKISPEEKQALFEGYKASGGTLDQERIDFWMRFDKLGAAIFLFWRIHQSTRVTSGDEIEQYTLDFDNLVSSLKSVFL
jgi:aminoglycoside phosphotransferase (APT) family kinase protein